MNDDQELTASQYKLMHAARFALQCLRLEIDSRIVDDISARVEKAFAALASQEQPPQAPEGWRLVPIAPTAAMCLADWKVSLSAAHTDGGVAECVWRAMLNAAPRFEGLQNA